jgi:hypothetical protein
MTTLPSTDAKTLTGELEQNPIGKFWINEKVFRNNPEPVPLIIEFQIKAIRESENAVFYSADTVHWIREDFVFKNRYSAYRALIKQAESEMIEPLKPAE